VQGELVRPGHPIAASTVWQILHDAGIGPAPPRRTGPTWKQVLSAQARGIIAADFVHVDTVLLRRLYALIVRRLLRRPGQDPRVAPATQRGGPPQRKPHLTEFST
jgi:hypothetical protein